MEVEKRKRRDDGQVDGKKCKGEEDDDAVKKLPADDEVEEFFAILKRLHVAVKYFEGKRNRDGGRELTTKVWSPSFQREDFEEVNAVKKEDGGGRIEGNRGKIVGLDLNSEPAGERFNSESVKSS